MLPSKKYAPAKVEKKEQIAFTSPFTMLMPVSLTSVFGPAVDQILDNLYLGNALGSREKELLKKKGVTHILVAGRFLPKHFIKEFEYHSIPIVDLMSENLFPHIEQAINFIKKGMIVFVHCAAGVSRSSSIVIAYLMIEKKMRFQEAYEFVKKRRPVISPNPGFQSQLIRIGELLEKKLLISKSLPVCHHQDQSLPIRQ